MMLHLLPVTETAAADAAAAAVDIAVSAVNGVHWKKLKNLIIIYK